MSVCCCRSDAGINDCVVVQELLKGMAQNQNLDSSHKAFKGWHGNAADGTCYNYFVVDVIMLVLLIVMLLFSYFVDGGGPIN